MSVTVTVLIRLALKLTGKRKNVCVKRFEQVIFVIQVHNWGSDNKMRSSSSSKVL